MDDSDGSISGTAKAVRGIPLLDVKIECSWEAVIDIALINVVGSDAFDV